MKKFLIIGNMNAISYREIFPYFKEDAMWLGCSSFNCGMFFGVPDDYEYSDTYKFDRERDGRKVMRVSSICWYTNLDHSKRHEPLALHRRYTPAEYPKYDHYDAIEVAKVADIPVDYDGVMGVPITFLDKYCPEQFEILDSNNRYAILDYFGMNETIRCQHSYGCNVGGNRVYARIFIRKR